MVPTSHPLPSFKLLGVILAALVGISTIDVTATTLNNENLGSHGRDQIEKTVTHSGESVDTDYSGGGASNVIHGQNAERNLSYNHTGTAASRRPCVDTHETCEYWASIGECKANPAYMLLNCRRSCETCTISETIDFGVEQTTPHGADAAKVEGAIRESIAYMRDVIMVKKEHASVRHICQNKHASCSYWASVGECTKNKAYMNMNCAPACKTCEMMDVRTRCPIDPNEPNALQPGDLNKLFERITTSPDLAKYNPVINSRPENPVSVKDGEDTGDYQTGPWIVTFDNLLTDEECDRLIALGHEQVYKRSSNVGKLQADGTYGSDVSDTRTSENAWCRDSCLQDPVARRVMDRIANITGISEKNSEHLQLLKYEVGQYYQRHHDFIPHHTERMYGPRILTFFLYLNDVEEGGGTRFTDMDLIVKPKRGSAVLWPSVQDSDPNAIDERTHHEAMPVIKGTKYGANAWIHLRDFKTPFDNGCGL